MNKKGFTLIELLAVIVILGVLMVVAIPAVTKYIESAKKQAFVTNVNSLVKTVKAEAAYRGKEKCYARVSDIDLEKGKLSDYVGFIYIDQNNEVTVDVADTKNKLAFYNKKFNEVNTSSVDVYNRYPDDNTYTENCLTD